MSIAKRQIERKRDGGKGRGSTNNKRRLDAFQKGVGSTPGDWGGCDPRRLQAVLVAITGLGGAVTFGLSRDGGAHSVTLLLDGERETLWFNGNAELDEELDMVIGALDAMK